MYLSPDILAHLSEVSEFIEPSEFKEYLQSPEVALLLRAAKVYGFSDFQIARAVGLEHRMKMEQAGLTIRKWRKMLGLVPTVNQIDTLAAEYPARPTTSICRTCRRIPGL